jgi:hypothetical protein
LKRITTFSPASRTEKEKNLYGVQFRGTLQPNQSQWWFTYHRPANNDVSWMVLPTTAQVGSPHVGFDLAIERAGNNTVTYWLTIHNLTGDQFDFEARYNFLN